MCGCLEGHPIGVIDLRERLEMKTQVPDIQPVYLRPIAIVRVLFNPSFTFLGGSLMRQLTLLLAAFAVIGTANALIPNADFEGGTYSHWTGSIIANEWGAYWNQIEGWGSPSTVYWETDGTNGYMVANVDGTQGGGGYAVAYLESVISLAALGISPGDAIIFSADIIDLISGGGGGGAILKVESWAGASNIHALEVVIDGVTTEWKNFSMDYIVADGADSIKLVFGTSTAWGGPNPAPSSYGFDNLTVIPEPTTMALLGLGAVLLRRRT